MSDFSKLSFLFPGQGAQKVGMGEALFDTFSASREVFLEVDDALDYHLSHLIFKGSPEQLKTTEWAQPALFAMGLSAFYALQGEYPRLNQRIDLMAGHSLGEYTALAAAGVISLREGARLVRLRGQLMQAACQPGQGAMAAILGLSLEDVEEIVQAVTKEQTTGPASVCCIANDNCPGQIVISGHTQAVQRAMTQAKEKGSTRQIQLDVSVPSHSPLMAPAQDKLAQALDAVVFQIPCAPIISNITALPEKDPLQLRHNLLNQLTQRVRWRDSMAALQGPAIECGSTVLKGLMKRINNLPVYSIETPLDIEQFLTALDA